MPISFNNIPSNWLQPLYWVEIDGSMAGYPMTHLRTLLVGTAALATPATYANGTITLNDNLMTTQNIVVNGTTVTFGTNVLVGASVNATAQNLLTYLQGQTADAGLNKMTYSSSNNVVTCTSIVTGTAGNAYTLSIGTATGHVSVSARKLSDGASADGAEGAGEAGTPRSRGRHKYAH